MNEIQEDDYFGYESSHNVIKESNEVQITTIPLNLLSRLLYPNPVSLLTISSSDSQGIRQRNIMTCTWLTPINNQGGFVCSINQKRYTASFLSINQSFVLNIPTVDQKGLVWNIGNCSGRDVDKFQQFQLETCPVGYTLNTKVNSTTRKKKSLSKKNIEMEQASKNAFALKDCIAHTLCVIDQQQILDQHHLLICRQLAAYVRSDYWSGKIFTPQNPSLPSCMSFLGSQTFAQTILDSK